MFQRNKFKIFQNGSNMCWLALLTHDKYSLTHSLGVKGINSRESFSSSGTAFREATKNGVSYQCSALLGSMSHNDGLKS